MLFVTTLHYQRVKSPSKCTYLTKWKATVQDDNLNTTFSTPKMYHFGTLNYIFGTHYYIKGTLNYIKKRCSYISAPKNVAFLPPQLH